MPLDQVTQHQSSRQHITRRDALVLLGTAAAIAPQARAAAGLLSATRVDHVSLSVGNIDQAMTFYRRLFGNDVMKNSKTPRRYLRLGPCYMAIIPAAAGEAKRIDHFAIGIQNFNPQSTKSMLEKAGLKVLDATGGYIVTDPDGTRVQIVADQSWKQIKDAKPEAATGTKQDGLFHSRSMHHLAIQVSDMARSIEFYSKLFGEPTFGRGTPPQPTFAAGETNILLYNPAPNKPAKIDHFSVLVENFDAAAALAVVKSLGVDTKLSAEGTLNEFFDPDGIRIQVSFPGQTYGAVPAAKK